MSHAQATATAQSAEFFDRQTFGPFTLEHPRDGAWIVRSANDKCGGLFTSEEAAKRFVRQEARRLAH